MCVDFPGEIGNRRFDFPGKTRNSAAWSLEWPPGAAQVRGVDVDRGGLVSALPVPPLFLMCLVVIVVVRCGAGRSSP